VKELQSSARGMPHSPLQEVEDPHEPDAKYLLPQMNSPKKLKNTGDHQETGDTNRGGPEALWLTPRPQGCSVAAECGIMIRVLERHGRWNSDAISTYIPKSLETRLRVSQAVF
jgi:hypothetical protein